MAEENVRPKIRSYQCIFVLYPESQQSAIDWVQENFPCAWALHDKDVRLQEDFDKYVKNHDGKLPDWKVGDLKKPHVHFVCKFANQRYFSGIAKAISNGSGISIPENTIRRCNNLYKAYVYLWHLLTPNKFKYDETIVGLHDFDPPTEVENIGQLEDEQVQALLNMPNFKTVKEMATWAFENGCWASFKKNYILWKDIHVESKGHIDRRTTYDGLAKL